jgi:hypothetical protein
MGSHATHLSPKERWMVVAYVKELSKIGLSTDKAESKSDKKAASE